MTVVEVIQKSAGFLDRKGVESPRLQIELMLAHLLKLPRLNLYLNYARELNPGELKTLREMVRRRGNREPLQHILGSMSFCGLEMAVNRHVLIPRPETEILAERAWVFLNCAAPQMAGGGNPAGTTPVALDLGTGSGCLAIAMAVHSPAAQVYAVDISPAALETARANAVRHNVAERITLVAGDAFAPLAADLRCDLIVSNPPYIPTGEIGTLEPEVRDHDPRGALDGGADGLDFYRRMAVEARPRLSAAGRLMAEFGDGQGAALRELFTAHGWWVEAIERDYSGRERFLIACPVQP
jgi:release factor glutamine methyltransferase